MRRLASRSQEYLLSAAAMTGLIFPERVSRLAQKVGSLPPTEGIVP